MLGVVKALNSESVLNIGNWPQRAHQYVMGEKAAKLLINVLRGPYLVHFLYLVNLHYDTPTLYIIIFTAVPLTSNQVLLHTSVH